jgi:hypothetical protein
MSSTTSSTRAGKRENHKIQLKIRKNKPKETLERTKTKEKIEKSPKRHQKKIKKEGGNLLFFVDLFLSFQQGGVHRTQ